MLKKYRKTILAAVALVGTAVAALFPDVVLPDQELVDSVLTAVEEFVASTPSE